MQSGEGGNPQVNIFICQGVNPAVLGQAALGNIHIRQNLNPEMIADSYF